MTLSAREKVLSGAVGGILFIFLNAMLIGAFARQNTALRTELAQQRLEWSNMQALLGEQDLWAARDAALTTKQPRLVNENAAGPELLDMIKDVAKAHSVAIDNEALGGVIKSQYYRSVPVTVNTHSSWPDLVSFLYTLQQPDKFIVCESADIKVDPSDETKMLGQFTIARWYAPY